jgi:crossover junction endodeoxyribonuclease RuvC
MEGMQATRVLGIDPGLHITGYAVLERRQERPFVCEAGVIRSSASRAGADANSDAKGSASKESMPARILAIYDGLVEVLEQFEPGSLAVEQLYAHYQHPRTAILMGHARGVVLLAAAQKGLSVVSYNATRIKKAITGSGRASKEQIQRTMQRELGLANLPEPPDVADALAVALCHFYLNR